MNLQPPKRKKRWKWIASILLLLPVLLFGMVLLVVHFKQDDIIQSQVATMNKEHKGLISIGATHLSPFDDFPYISIKIDDVRIMETKEANANVVLNVEDIYVGFNLWDIIKGNYDIQSLHIENGFFNIVLHEDGSINIENALATKEDVEEEEPFNIHLKHIKLDSLDVHKFDEATGVDVETFIYWADGGFKTGDSLIASHVDAEFELNIIDNGDTTYVNHKHFEFHTDVTIDEKNGLITLKPSGITMEHGDFQIQGTINTKNDMDVDLSIKGTKPNFDMFFAFAPEDVIPILEQYKNAGDIYLNAVVKGPTLHGQMPFIEVNFGASKAFLENTVKRKRIDDMGFQGHFTNGAEKNLKTMEFSLTDMTASMEKGNFLGSVVVKNFEAPEVDMKMNADFNIEFLAGFLNLTDIQSATGSVKLEMKFHDIIDLKNPEKALNDLNKAYFTELNVKDLTLASSQLPAPISSLNMHVVMNGKKAELDQFDLKMGKSDVSVTGYLSDLPAIVHHTDKLVTAHLDIKSKMVDVAELTQFSKKDSTGIDEQIEDLKVGFSFVSSAKAFTESKYLPTGEFFIDQLHAQLKHYPHELHDFHADIIIDEKDLTIKDFTGYIDESDFHFNGQVHDYGFWMKKELNGDVDLDITLTSTALHLDDIFSYQGENFVPKDYRHEEFDNLVLHANTSMHYKNSALHSIDIDLDKLEAKMLVHPMRFENFNGRVHYEDDHIMIEKLHGKIGRTIFDVNMNYYLGKNEKIKKRDNYLALNANYIDFDQLFNFNPSPPEKSTSTNNKTTAVAEHEEAFNLYEIPFTDMQFDMKIGHFIYHRIDLQNINAQLRTTKNHYIYVDTLSMNAAKGSIAMSGYFNGSDPKHIYAKPNLTLKNVDIDKLLFKFESHGEDEALSKNLHGRLTAKINGNIRIYPDFIPDLDESEIHMDVQVLNGRLVNYKPMLLLSDYMGSKDLTNIRFDTLANHMDFKNGELNIPNMTLESTLGHFDISGKQDTDFNFEYYLRIPWKIVTQSASNKLFGSKKIDDNNTGDDEIIEVDPNKRTRYLNLKMIGNPDDFKIKPGKQKSKS